MACESTGSTIEGPFPFAVENVLELDGDSIKEIRDHLFVQTIALCYAAHPFYSRVMKDLGLQPRDFHGVEDRVLLPPTRKEQFLAEPDAFRLDPDHIPQGFEDAWPVEMRHLWEILYTTGTTTGVPAPVYTTTFDHHAYMLNVRRRRSFIDIRVGDVIGNVFPQTPFPMGAHTRAPSEAAACGASIVEAQTGRDFGPFRVHRRLDEAIELLETHRVTILWGIASFVRRLLRRAVELRADLSTLRLVMFTGEAASSELQADMRQQLSALGCENTDVVNRYGSTEQGSSMVECRPGSGFHNLGPDQVFIEVVDAESGEPAPDGHAGHLAFTHLIRRGTVLLRYMPGDVTSLARDPCARCGRHLERIGPDISRSGSLTKIKGTLINLDRLCDQVGALVAPAEFQVVVQPAEPDDTSGGDELVIRVASDVGADLAAETLANRVGQAAQITPRIEFVETESIVDPTASVKARRIVDAR